MNKQFSTSIRKMALTLSAITLLVTLNSCGSGDDPNIERFREAVMKLDKTNHTLTDEFDYWPECGIRVTGSHLASLISLDELQKMLPCPLYVSGPHHDGQWDLENEDDFGHYNPEAIQYLADLAKEVVSDKNFVSMSKPLIDEHLYLQMHIMMVLHDALYDELFFDQAYRTKLFKEMIENNGYGDLAFEFLSSLNLDDDGYVYGNIGDRFLYFWARRWKDGTIDQFYQGLSTIFKAYYPDYKFSWEKYERHWDEDDIDDYLYEGNYDEDWIDYGEGHYATIYSYPLEEDEPIADDERINEKDAIKIFRSALANVSESFNVLTNEFDYWPEGGIRITGSHLFSLVSLRTLNRILPCDLYVSGPHHYNRWELDDPFDYGHYNPEAINYLDQLAKKMLSDKDYVKQTKPLVDEYLKRQMTILLGLYNGFNNPNLCPDKEALLEDIMLCRGHANYSELSAEFLQSLEDDLEDGSYLYSNTGEMFLYWWARRYSDGTMELFHEGLETVYNAYYGK